MMGLGGGTNIATYIHARSATKLVSYNTRWRDGFNVPPDNVQIVIYIEMTRLL
jgi:hypothetical protein